MAAAGRIRRPDREIAETPLHRVDAGNPARTACGEPLAQTAPEPWHDVPPGARCPRCADDLTGPRG